MATQKDRRKVEKLGRRWVLMKVRTLVVQLVPAMVDSMVVVLDASVVDYWDAGKVAELVVH